MPLSVIETAGLTDVGRQRRANEDSMLEAEPVFAVADGMGGARAGEVASQTAVEMLASELPREGSPEDRLRAVAQAVNTRIFQLAQEDETRSGMGTTFTAVIVDGDQISVGHVGDSRLYRLRGSDLERLTRDHSLVEELVRRGELDPEDVESHPQRAIITRALGPSPEVEVETFTVPSRDGDVYLLCSDGLTTMVREPQIADIMRSRSSLDDAARRLVNTANENGGRDNVTVSAVPARRRGHPGRSGATAGRDTRRPARRGHQGCRRGHRPGRRRGRGPPAPARRRRGAVAPAPATSQRGHDPAGPAVDRASSSPGSGSDSSGSPISWAPTARA